MQFKKERPLQRNHRSFIRTAPIVIGRRLRRQGAARRGWLAEACVDARAPRMRPGMCKTARRTCTTSVWPVDPLQTCSYVASAEAPWL